jgi:formylglycine-generating enzyme required for sulfatase activity
VRTIFVLLSIFIMQINICYSGETENQVIKDAANYILNPNQQKGAEALDNMIEYSTDSIVNSQTEQENKYDEKSLPNSNNINLQEYQNLKSELNSKPFKSITNELGMRFLYVQPGQFIMGSPQDELGRSPNETRHRVTITRGYYLQTTEVTQNQWQSIMGRNPSKFKSCGGDCPVDSVSMQDIQEFIDRLNHKEGGQTYRLPTEAEWEYACRSGSSGPFAGDIDEIAWYKDNSNKTTHPVAQKKPNAWDFYDMHGNVLEWCQDWYAEFSEEDSIDPVGPIHGPTRILRGGSWDYVKWYCRSAMRVGFKPHARSHLAGFRLVLNPVQQ